MNGQHIPEEDLALYAMRALAGAEETTVADHLHSCEECRRQLRWVSGTLALISMSVPQQSIPEGARERFLNRIASAPKPGTATVPRPAETAPSAASAPVQRVPEPRRRANWFPVLIPLAAAFALLILAGYLGRKNQRLTDQLKSDQGQIAQLAAQAAQAQQVLETLTSPEAQRATLSESRAAVTPSARASYLPQRGALIFVANNLKPIPSSKTYELWIIPADGRPPVPAGLFRPDARGDASLVLPKLPPTGPAKAFGVTVENAEGATSPTLPIVLSGAAGL